MVAITPYFWERWYTYSKVAIHGLSASQCASDLGRSRFDCRLHGILLKLDGHRKGLGIRFVEEVNLKRESCQL